MEAMSDWRAFWDSAHSIYVNARHKDVHYREIADQIAAFVPGPSARVLDYGCGEAIHAARVAAVACEVLLCDSAPSVRAGIAARFSGEPRIRVLAPAEVERLPDGSIDLIVANSMTQYLEPAELDRALALWRRLLAPSGTLIVGDVIPPNAGTLTDVAALLRYAVANGFLLAALLGLARTVASPYRRLRSRLGVTRYTQEAFLQKLKAAGFAGERLARNLEHNSARMSFRARPI
ncbi:MAG TPA: class I SAM-dependent methyltransferase [Xanthobacteraceae bacterium]|jgi:SAM-dependent methyltransferase|nr:class I SAM-dependent methyltransferase [Xanthobacteraceae bacterium]